MAASRVLTGEGPVDVVLKEMSCSLPDPSVGDDGAEGEPGGGAEAGWGAKLG